ncbi:hypothetical protein L5515_017671 [Caenorhabditis briggsae]|uniref:Uncharacterized protein n=1 Tax=Caenorhabditis briggsae TaxID=6238 RepID=A0AAE9FH86_CAEBR|nr:hypothetical protein L5515_017671 [Caenorhabditis briggsae]
MICILFIIAFSMVKAESIPDQTIELLNITDSMYTSVLVPEERSQEYMVFPADNQVSRTKKPKAKAWQNTYKAQRINFKIARSYHISNFGSWNFLLTSNAPDNCLVFLETTRTKYRRSPLIISRRRSAFGNPDDLGDASPPATTKRAEVEHRSGKPIWIQYRRHPI